MAIFPSFRIATLYAIIVLSVKGDATHNIRSRRSRKNAPKSSVRAVQVKRRIQEEQTTLFSFGEDLNPGEVREPLTEFPNAMAARDDFFTYFKDAETENFDDFAVGQHFPLTSMKFSQVSNYGVLVCKTDP